MDGLTTRKHKAFTAYCWQQYWRWYCIVYSAERELRCLLWQCVWCIACSFGELLGNESTSESSSRSRTDSAANSMLIWYYVQLILLFSKGFSLFHIRWRSSV